MPMNRAFIGRTYPPVPDTVDAEAIRKYLRGINEDNPAFPAVAPPLYATVFSIPHTAQPLFDPELGANIKRILHGETDLEIHSLLRPGMTVQTEACVAALEGKPSGEIADLAFENRTPDGQLLSRGSNRFFFRAKGSNPDGTKDVGADAATSPPPALEATFATLVDQPRLYAEGSGDFFPIHTDDAFAKSVGLPGVILHGMCTLALTVKTLTDALLSGDPHRVRRIKVRFSNIVFPGETLRVRAWPIEPGLFRFETRTAAGKPALSLGQFGVT